MRASRAAILCAFLVGLFSAQARAGPLPDRDSDGFPDVVDICSANPLAPDHNFCDTDLDGYGNQCDADLNNDGVVGGPDFAIWGAAFGSSGAPCFHVGDLNGNGVVGSGDFAIFGSNWGKPPGPSGLPCAGFVPCR